MSLWQYYAFHKKQVAKINVTSYIVLCLSQLRNTNPMKIMKYSSKYSSAGWRGCWVLKLWAVKQARASPIMDVMTCCEASTQISGKRYSTRTVLVAWCGHCWIHYCYHVECEPFIRNRRRWTGNSIPCVKPQLSRTREMFCAWRSASVYIGHPTQGRQSETRHIGTATWGPVLD